jgi:hypothetical protein
MSGLAIGRGKVIGTTAAVAVLLLTMSGTAQAAAQHPDPSMARVAPHAVATGVSPAATVPSVCTIDSYAPKKIVLGAVKVSATFSVKVDGCTLAGWSTYLWPFADNAPLSTSGSAGNYWYWDKNAAGDEVKVQLHPKISLSPRYLTNSLAGRLATGTYVQAWGEEDDEETVDPAAQSMPLTLQRRASFGSSFNAGPEPVEKGKKITITGKLVRIDWNGAKTLKYVGFAGKARVQFKAAGASKYVTVKTVTASSKGKVSTTVKATKTGSWRLFYPGVSTTAPATSGSDAVKVN